jgi:hypothetical protein
MLGLWAYFVGKLCFLSVDWVDLIICLGVLVLGRDLLCRRAIATRTTGFALRLSPKF